MKPSLSWWRWRSRFWRTTGPSSRYSTACLLKTAAVHKFTDSKSHHWSHSSDAAEPITGKQDNDSTNKESQLMKYEERKSPQRQKVVVLDEWISYRTLTLSTRFSFSVKLWWPLMFHHQKQHPVYQFKVLVMCVCTLVDRKYNNHMLLALEMCAEQRHMTNIHNSLH